METTTPAVATEPKRDHRYTPGKMLTAITFPDFADLPKARKIELLDFWYSNAVEALRLWRTVPPQNVSKALGSFRETALRDPFNCGTIACFGGWLPAMPHFIALGVTRTPIGAPRLSYKHANHTIEKYRFDLSRMGDEPNIILFGSNLIFEPAAGNEYDSEDSDHRVVVDRLESLIRETTKALAPLL